MTCDARYEIISGTTLTCGRFAAHSGVHLASAVINGEDTEIGWLDSDEGATSATGGSAATEKNAEPGS